MPDITHRCVRGGAFVITAALWLMADASSGLAAGRTKYPLTLQNCGVSITFGKAPQRAVTIGQNSTEILLSLGLADRIAGTSWWFGPVLKQFESENAKIKRLADGSPSFETVVAQEPDLVAVQFESDIAPQSDAGARGQYADLGIPTYISPADCVKDYSVSNSGDGVRKAPFTMELVYQEIQELAEIFDVQERGERLVGELKKREAGALASVAASKVEGLPVVFWYSSKQLKDDAFVAGRMGAPAYILRAFGARNVIDSDEDWPLVGWETIAGKNPAVIVVAEMGRRRRAADDPAEKIKFLKTDPVTSQLEAVKARRFVVMNAQSMDTTIRTIDGIEALADGLRQFGLTN
ncbi:ABC transporter substrate-binding protein [Brucella sp. IR073]|uniref:ABC transporter substrate-binding protein n=1 Tax=unclassified Brucella TaxID=2632610 RepID=UPI003B980E6B